MTGTTTYWCERAWLGPGDLADGVLVEVDGSRIGSVRLGPREGAVTLAGITVPGFANCHSHAFHRALRARTQRERGTFWTWRDAMYDVAERLDPDTYYTLALATYQEMTLAGITSVGEFHYLHHDSDGTPYADPNAMGAAVVAAARDAGLRVALLDACYVSAGFGRPPEGVQRRFSDGDASQWASRVGQLRSDGSDVVIGAAIHSVRAVPREQLATVGQAMDGAPLHVHLSEQVAENDACEAAYGVTPTRLLADADVLTQRLSAVHATHLTEDDVALLGQAGCYADLCPTTERDLADGIGPARQLVDAGVVLTLGSDSHAVIDLNEEMRAVELDERLRSMHRGHFTADELLVAATADGHASLGLPDAGRIAPGAWADLVTFDMQSPRLAGTGANAESVVFAATAADISHVVASGRRIELDPGGVGAALTAAIGRVVGQR